MEFPSPVEKQVHATKIILSNFLNSINTIEIIKQSWHSNLELKIFSSLVQH